MLSNDGSSYLTLDSAKELIWKRGVNNYSELDGSDDE